MTISYRAFDSVRRSGVTPFFLRQEEKKDPWEERQSNFNLPDYTNPYAPSPQYNPRFGQRPLTQTQEQMQDVNRGIVNYQTRISAVGEEVPEHEKKPNRAIRALQALDSLRNATFVGLDHFTQHNKTGATTGGGAAFLEGAKKGFTREEELYGSDLMERMGVENKAARAIGGFALDMAGDPLTYVSMGLGSLLKGAITGRGGTMAADTAQKLARAGLSTAKREVVETAVKNTVARNGYKIGAVTSKAAHTISEEAFQKIVTGKAYNEITRIVTQNTLTAAKGMSQMQGHNLALAVKQKMLTDFGVFDKKQAVDLLWDSATKALATFEKFEHSKMARKGVSFFGQQIGDLSTQRMQDIGAGLSQAVTKANIPFVSKGLETSQDIINSIFKAHWVKGASATQNAAFRRITQDAMYTKNMLDEGLLQKTKALANQLKKGRTGEQAAQIDKALTHMIEGTLDASDDKVIRGVMKEITSDLKNWGIEEQNLGVLKTILDDYIPHVMNWDLPESAKKHLARGGMSRDLRIWNANSARRKAGTTLDEAQAFMQFKTADIEERVKFIKHMMNTSSEEAVQKFNKALNKAGMMDNMLDALDEILTPGASQDVIDMFLSNEHAFVNRAMHHLDGAKNLDIVGSGIKNFFEESALRSYIQRGLSHNKILSDKQLVDQMTAAFGQKITGPAALESAARNGKTIVVKRDSFKAIGVDLDEMQNVSAIKRIAKHKLNQKSPDDVRVVRDAVKNATRKVKGAKAPILSSSDMRQATEVAEGFMKGTTEFTGEAKAVIQKLLNTADKSPFAVLDSDQYALLARYMPIEGYAFDPSIIQTINRSAGGQVDAGIKSIGGVIDAFHRIWKPSVTGWRPDYYIRNFFGDSFNTYIEQGLRGLNPKVQANAVKLASGSFDPEDTIKLGGKLYKMKDIQEGYVRYHVNANFFRADAANLTEAMFDRQVGKLSRSTIPTGAADKAKKAVKKGYDVYVGATRNFGGKAEDYLRYTHYLSGLDRGMDFRRAAELTKYFHFDYSDLSTAERKLIRRVIPFYTWARNNIPLQLETLLNDPTRHLSAHRMIRNIEMGYELDSADVPDWMRKGMSLPLPMESLKNLPGPLGKGFTAAHEQGRIPYLNWGLPINNLGMTAQDALGMVSPFIKAPVEMTINRNMRTGAPISRMPETRTQDYANYMWDQFGALRNVRMAMEGDPPPEELEGKVTLPMLPTVPYTGGMGRSNMLAAYSPEQGHLRARYDYSRQLGNRVQYLQHQGLPVPDVGQADWMRQLTPQQLDILRRTGNLPFFMR